MFVKLALASEGWRDARRYQLLMALGPTTKASLVLVCVGWVKVRCVVISRLLLPLSDKTKAIVYKNKYLTNLAKK